MRSKLKKALAVLASAAMCGSMLLDFPNGTFGISRELTASAAGSDGVQTALDITYGNITIGDGTLSGYGADGIALTEADPDGYSITGTTTAYTVTVNGGTHNITLDNVNIAPEAASPVSVASGAALNLTLAGDNTLTGGKYEYGSESIGYAGIHVPTGASLSIGGTGTLTAQGGTYWYSAPQQAIFYNASGIGGNAVCSAEDAGAGTITINGGMITAVGGDLDNYAAPSIGGGYCYDSNAYKSVAYDGTCTAVNITGGVVKANTVESLNQTGGILFSDGNVTVAETFTLTEELTIASGKSINFVNGASITNPELLILENGAVVQVEGVVHTHNTDGTVTYTDITATTHTPETACLDCPVAHKTEGEAEPHSTTAEDDSAADCHNLAYCSVCDSEYGTTDPANANPDCTIENGFYSCGAYQPAVLNDNGTADDTTDDYYEISNAGQLYWFMELVNNYGEIAVDIDAVLTADITVNANVLDVIGTADEANLRAWTPIGNDTTYYAGTFDGQNYTISGLYFSDAAQNCVGLFGLITPASEIKNVTIADSYFCGDEAVGSVCGYNLGKITNCTNSGEVKGAGRAIGGICGNNIGGTITGCTNSGKVSSDADAVGGICGNIEGGTIQQCTNNGEVSGAQAVGGVCGYNNAASLSTIEECVNTGKVSGTGQAVGGVFGSGINNSKTEVINCANHGAVSGGTYIGGVCGWNVSSGTVANCISTGTVSGDANVGGVCGGSLGKISVCYYSSTAYTGNAVGLNYGTTTDVEGRTAEQLASGEVAYLLSQGCTVNDTFYSGDVWGQKLGTDAYPLLSDDTVYYGYKDCYSTVKTYINTEPHPTIGHKWENGVCAYCGNTPGCAHPDYENGFCVVCDHYEPAVLNDNDTAEDTTDDF